MQKDYCLNFFFNFFKLFSLHFFRGGLGRGQVCGNYTRQISCGYNPLVSGGYMGQVSGSFIHQVSKSISGRYPTADDLLNKLHAKGTTTTYLQHTDIANTGLHRPRGRFSKKSVGNLESPIQQYQYKYIWQISNEPSLLYEPWGLISLYVWFIPYLF